VGKVHANRTCKISGKGATRNTMGTSAKTRVLYLGVGAPHAPSSGMDVVSQVHLEELLGATSLDVTGLVVTSGTTGLPGGRQLASMGGVSIIAADPIDNVSRVRLSLTKAIYAFTSCGAMIAFSFRSAAARSFIHDSLTKCEYDVVIFDHYNSLANIEMRDLRACRAKLIYIAHDVMPTQIRETGLLKRRWYKTVLFELEAWKAAYHERALLRLSLFAIFLSDYDRSQYRRIAVRPLTLIPMLKSQLLPKPDRASDRTLLFIGSPSFSPNAFAIRWLIERFAPLLYRADPSIRVLLAGKGTEDVATESENVTGLGFVSNSDLMQLIDTGIGMMCPVLHGSGIKIKVLDAIARGCLVFATSIALRGLERFEIEPLISISDPRGSVDRIVALTNNPAKLIEQRTRLLHLWWAHCSTREGQLADIAHKAGMWAG
jgi:hypothetical protein